ncbi:MAG: VOC family protein [Longimicrobiales bacterium]
MLLDHVVSVDPDLPRAAAAYRALGLPVRTGGRHRGQPTRNELIPLSGGTYLELLGPTSVFVRPALRLVRRTPFWDGYLSGREPIPRRFLRLLAQGGGLSDFCLAATDLGAAVERVRGVGAAVSDPIRMTRTRPDGVELAWRLAVPDDPFLPFMVEDETPRHQRAPRPPDADEGVLASVTTLTAAVPRLSAALPALEALFDQRPRLEDGGALAAFDLLHGVSVRMVERPDTGLAHRVELTLRVPGDGAPAGRWPVGVGPAAPSTPGGASG